MVFFIFIKIFTYCFVSKKWLPDQTLRFAASDLGLHSLHMSHQQDARLIWVNNSGLYGRLSQ